MENAVKDNAVADTDAAVAATETESRNANRSTTPRSESFAAYIGANWAERPRVAPAQRESATWAAERRARIGAMYPGERIVVPAGPARVRANDTDYAYRSHSDFAYLTGWGSDAVPGSILVLEPTATGHDATLYFLEPAGRDSDEFYANPAVGEFWVGPRPSLADVAADLGLATASLKDLPAGIDPDADPEVAPAADTPEAAIVRDLSELRLVKDEYEIEQLREAIAVTKRGFDDVIADLPTAIATERGERVVDGTFGRRARIEGNDVGYGTIAASGPHACILHWTRNDGPVVPGDLILIDAGVELDSLYTADITRTLPVDGRFTEVQRRVYDAVLEAADAAFAVVRPGVVFREVHAAAMRVIAERTAEWGLLPVPAEVALQEDHQEHRRYMVHGTSHHLGIDVHDCAKARTEFYKDGVIRAGMVFTIEPGLYFQPDDLTVPEEYRGIGIRIEDDIVVTADGAERLSAGIPRTADDVERWLAGA